MFSHGSSIWKGHPGQGPWNQYHGTELRRAKQYRGSAWLETMKMPENCSGPIREDRADGYAADELLDKVKITCTSLLALLGRLQRIHLQASKKTRELSTSRWRALTSLHHALFQKELDSYLASDYSVGLSHPSNRGSRYIVEIADFIWPEHFHTMLAFLQERLPKSHRNILERGRGYPVARMTEVLTEQFSLFCEVWSQVFEDLAHYCPRTGLSGSTVLRIDVPKIWYDEAQERDFKKAWTTVYRHIDLGGSLQTNFRNAPRGNFPFSSMRSSSAVQTFNSATREAFWNVNDEMQARPSIGLLTPETLLTLGMTAPDSGEWGQGRLSRWRQHYGQGRSRTWRYRLYVKATKQQVSALAEKPRPCYLHVNLGPTSKLPIALDRLSMALATDLKLGKKRRRVERQHIDKILLLNEASSDSLGEHPDLNEPQESSYAGDDVDCFYCVPFSSNSERLLALPYVNFIGAFLAPSYRVRRFLRQENHGEVYTVTHFARPQVNFEAKVYNMKALSRNSYNYRVRDIKRLERQERYVETIRQGGRRLVISAAVLEAPDGNTQQNPLLCKGTHDYQLAYPPLPKVMTVMFSTHTPKMVVQSADMFYRLKALRIALEAGLRSSNLFCHFPKRPAGSFRYCTTPEGEHAEHIKTAGSMERKQRRQKRRRLNDKQRRRGTGQNLSLRDTL